MSPAPPPRPLPPAGPVRPDDEREQLINFLERDQLVSDTLVPVPPAALSRAAQMGLWALRIFAVVVSAMVVYTFVSQL